MHFPSGNFYVTATDTDAGKTVVGAALIHALGEGGERVVGMKPVASGCEWTPQGLRNADALQLQSAGTVEAAYDLINPYAFAPPIAPEFAARQVGTVIELSHIAMAFAQLQALSDRVVVEGFGGWLSPVDAHLEQSDLVQALGLGVILVVPLRVGCIHQARATALAIAQDGAPLLGWIANARHGESGHDAAHIAAIRRYLPAPLLATVSGQGQLSIRRNS